MNKKLLFNRILKIGSLLLAVILTLLLLQEFVLCRLDDNRERIKGFYLEDDDSIDVAFIGSSEVYSGYSASYAYARSGFTSYPIATRSNTVRNYLTCVKEAVRTQHPKLIVIEINGVLYNDTYLNDETFLRSYADNIPLNDNKLELVDRWLPELKTEFIFPLIKYHTVWESDNWGLDWGLSVIVDRFRGYNLLKGMKNMAAVYSPQEEVLNDQLSSYDAQPLSDQSQTSFIELLDYCRDNELNVLFVRFPHVVHKKMLLRYERSLAAAELVRSYGFTYLGLDEEYGEIGLDLSKDFYNAEHLNVYGQQKLTAYLCDYMTKNCGITPSELTDAQRREWEDAARYYEAYYRCNAALIGRYSGKEEPIYVGENFLSMRQVEKYL